MFKKKDQDLLAEAYQRVIIEQITDDMSELKSKLTSKGFVVLEFEDDMNTYDDVVSTLGVLTNGKITWDYIDQVYNKGDLSVVFYDSDRIAILKGTNSLKHTDTSGALEIIDSLG